MSGLMLNLLIVGSILSYIYKKFIKDNNSNSTFQSINEIVNSVRDSIESNKAGYKNPNSSQSQEFKVKSNYSNNNNKELSHFSKELGTKENYNSNQSSYENALSLYKAGFISKKELKEYRK